MSITVTALDKLAFVKKIDSNEKILLVACPSDFKVGSSANASSLIVLGELQISGSSYFLKPAKFAGGLSGSLTQLTDGTPYIVAASGITATTGSSGQITLSADGSESPAAGSNNQIQFNDGGSLGSSTNLWFGSSGLYVTGSIIISGDSTLGDASGDTVTVNAGTVTFATAPGIDASENTVLIINSSNALKRNEIDSKVWAGDLVDYTGTPANNQVAIWTDTDTLEGDTNLTWDGTTLATAGNQTLITSNAGLTNDRALLVQNLAVDCSIQIDAYKNSDPNVVLSENTGVKWSMGNNNANDNLRFRNASFASTKMELTQDGELILSSQPLVSASRTTHQAFVVTYTSAQTMVFNNDYTAPNFDVGGDYNTSTGIFTAPADGKYYVKAGTLLYNVPNDSTILLKPVFTQQNSKNLYRNYLVGPNWTWSAGAAADIQYFNIRGDWIIPMDSGDTLYIQAQANQADSGTKFFGHASNWYTHLYIAKIA